MTEITQLVERPTEKPGAILIYGTGSSPRCGEGIFLPEPTSGADSLTVSMHTAPVCNRMLQYLCAR